MTSAQQRAELQRQIWQIANDVRGSVDGWDFKQYVLGTLFYRFISENFTNFITGGDESVNYAAMDDEDELIAAAREDAIKTKGYFIYPSGLFVNIAAGANKNKNLNTDLADIFRSIEASANGHESEQDIKGLFADFDTTSNRLGNTVNDKNVGVDNLVANKGGRVDANYMPNTERLTAYESGDILLGNIRPYLKKVWKATNSGGCSGDVLAVRILRELKSAVDSDFLYYLLSSDAFFSYNMQHAKGAKMPRGNKAAILNYQIPIPCPENPGKSLKIQVEIVRILDTFTELTTELNARKKQYNYYRDQLLSFEDGDVEWKTLGEIGEFIRGKRFTKADYVESNGIDVIHYGEIYTQYGTSTSHALSQVRTELTDLLRYAEPNDVVITSVGETVEDVGKAVAWLGSGNVAIHDDSYALRHSLNPKYLSYCMQTETFIAEKAKHVSRGKVKRLLINGMSKVRIPIPYPNDPEKSLAEQARIVAILDKFDILTTSINEGLPREIKLRQKQYEYYRDLLLSFPKPN